MRLFSVYILLSRNSAINKSTVDQLIAENVMPKLFANLSA